MTPAAFQSASKVGGSFSAVAGSGTDGTGAFGVGGELGRGRGGAAFVASVGDADPQPTT